MKEILLFGGLLFFSIIAKAQFSDKVIIGAMSSICSNTSASSSALSVVNNPSSMSEIKQGVLSVISLRPFGISKWNASSISVIGLGNRLKYGGYCWYEKVHSYSSISLSSVFAKSIGTKMDVGVNFHFSKESVAHYFSTSQIGTDFGYSYKISSKTLVSISMINLIATNLKKASGSGMSGNGVSSKLISSFSYKPFSKISLAIALEKEYHQIPNIAIGVDYHLLSVSSFRLGVSTSTQTFFSSFTFKLKKNELTVMESYHQQLGFSSGLQFSYFFSNKNE